MSTVSPNYGRDHALEGRVRAPRRRVTPPAVPARVQQQASGTRNTMLGVLAGAGAVVGSFMAAAGGYMALHRGEAAAKDTDPVADTSPATPEDLQTSFSEQIADTVQNDPEQPIYTSIPATPEAAVEPVREPTQREIFANTMQAAGGEVVHLDDANLRRAEAMKLCFAVYVQDNKTIFVTAREGNLGTIERQFVGDKDPVAMAIEALDREEQEIVDATIAEFKAIPSFQTQNHAYAKVRELSERVREQTASEKAEISAATKMLQLSLDKKLEVAVRS